MNSLLNYAYFYPASLLVISVFVASLERLFPRRKNQPVIRRALGWDLVHLVFNGHFLGVLVYGIVTKWIIPPVDAWVAGAGATDVLYANAASSWPVALQIVVALFAIDFVQ